MLHITSWMQGLSGKNKAKETEIKLYQHDFLRDVRNRRRQSSLSNSSSHHDNRYHYDVEDFNSVGYWGCVRDRNADTLLLSRESVNNNKQKQRQETSEVFWGQFEDELHSAGLIAAKDSNSNSMASPETVEGASNASQSTGVVITASNLNNNRNYLYDFKSSKLKIQAIKRDESKILLQKLQEMESAFSKETVKLFDISGSTASPPVSPTSSNNILSTNLAPLLNRPSSSSSSETPSAVVTSAHKLINLVHFGQHSSSSSSSPATTTDNTANDSIAKLQNLKNMLDVLTKLNKSINIFVGDLALNTNDQQAAAKCESLFSSMNIHACMNGVNDLYKSYLIDKSLAAAASQTDQDTTASPTTSIGQDMRNLMLSRKMNTVYLCSNIYERVRQKLTNVDVGPGESSASNSFKSFGFGNHSTMILECNGVKIGFMALVDESVCRRLLKKVYSKKSCYCSGSSEEEEEEERYYRDLLRSKIEYSDYLNEAKRLSEQLRLCGANLIVALANMDKEDELARLVNEPSVDVDLVLSNTNDQARPAELKFSKEHEHRWVVKGAASFDCLSLISLKVDMAKNGGSNKMDILDMAITKYNSN